MERQPPSFRPEQSPESSPPNLLTLEAISQVATENALKYDGHVPTLIVEGSQHAIILSLAELADRFEGRAHQVFRSGLALARSGKVGQLKQVFFVSEGWMSRARGGARIDRPPSQDPNRIEVLTIANLDVIAQIARLAVFEMVRDTEERVTELKRFHQDDQVGQRVESPLLAAFVQGYDLGKGAY